MGGKFHLKLNIGSRPIANKYHEGKVKRTLKRELKVPEIAEKEANRTSTLGEIAEHHRYVVLDQRKCSSAQISLTCSVVLALCVNYTSALKKTPRTWVFAFG